VVTAVVRQAADRLDGVVEIGAVNAVTNKALKARFGVSAFPAFYLYSSEYQVHVQFPWTGPRTFVDDVQKWAKATLAEWEQMFASSAVERFGTPEAFELEVANSTDLWLVIFTSGGGKCAACSAAMPNVHRLSADLRGVARVGHVDCTLEGLAQICAAHLGDGGEPPHFRIFPHGLKAGATAGAMPLFGSGDVELHLAFPLIATVIRSALADQAPAVDTAVGAGDADAFEYGAPKEPPPPQQQQQRYHAAPQKPRHVQIGSSGRRTLRIT